MNKKQLLQQVERLAALASESAKELQALHIRLAENEQALKQCRQELQTVWERCASAEQKVQDLELKAAQLKPEPEEILLEEPDEQKVQDWELKAAQWERCASAVPKAAVQEPLTNPQEVQEYTEEGEEPQARIPDFCEEKTNFEVFFHAKESSRPNEADLQPTEPVEVLFSENAVDQEQVAEKTDVAVSAGENSDVASQDVFNNAAVQNEVELQNYCARLIGRIALAAARVIVHCPEQPETANIKDLALAQSEKFKTQATAYLSQRGEISVLQHRLDTLAIETEQYLHSLSVQMGE